MHYTVGIINILWLLPRNLNHYYLSTGTQGVGFVVGVIFSLYFSKIVLFAYIPNVVPLCSSSPHPPSHMPLRGCPRTHLFHPPLPTSPLPHPSSSPPHCFSLGHQVSTELAASSPTEATQISPLLCMCQGPQTSPPMLFA